MKKIIFLFTAGLVIQFSFAQSNLLDRANYLYGRTHFSLAAPMYEKIVNENYQPEVIERLGNCYYFMNDFKNANSWYSKLGNVPSDKLDNDFNFKYSHVLKAMGDYDGGNELLKKYYRDKGENSKMNDFDSKLEDLEALKFIGNRYDIENLKINTKQSDFGAFVHDRELLFTAPKMENERGAKKMFKWDMQPYLDIFSVPVDSLDIKYKKNFNKMTGKMHESTPFISTDSSYVYFTSNQKKKDKKGVSHLAIYRAKLVDDKMEDKTYLSFNSVDYSVCHPYINSDGSRLYFSSDMPGSLGSFDIFYVDIEGDTFGEPVNMGEKINTIQKEQFPFVDGDENLYFSSDGHVGFGALDIYYSEKDFDEFNEPINVGLPVNSSFDDFAYYLNEDNKTGFFSSNRIGGMGKDDIYSFVETRDLRINKCFENVVVNVYDKISSGPLSKANVKIRKEGEDDDSSSYFSNKIGKAIAKSSCNTSYSISVEKDKYISEVASVKTSREWGKENVVDIYLLSIEDKNAEDKRRAEIAKQEEERLRALGEKRKKELLAKLEKEKELNEEKERQAVVVAKEVKKKRLQNRIEEITQKEKDVKVVNDQLFVELPEFYFDVGLWYVRRYAKVALGKVINILDKYPEFSLEIGCHTDNRGNDQFNLNLSQKRSEAILDYLVEQGIDESRLKAVGYGETKPIIECPRVEDCGEEQHEINRRSEFLLLSNTVINN